MEMQKSNSSAKLSPLLSEESDLRAKELLRSCVQLKLKADTLISSLGSKNSSKKKSTIDEAYSLYSEAIDKLDTLAKANRNSALIFYYLGLLLLKKGK